MAIVARALVDDRGVEAVSGGWRYRPIAQSIDRWIYVFTAASFIVITFLGFIPDSVEKIALIRAGQRPPFPLVLHFHAVLMGSFLVLLLAQTTLVAIGRQDIHRRLGRVAMILVPALVVVGFILVPTIYHQVWNAAQAAPPQARANAHEIVRHFDQILLFQIRIGVLFPLFLFLGLRARRTDSGFHRRMMILATAIPLPAAIDRIGWLPSSLPASSLSTELYMLLAVSPLFLWDVTRNRAVHKAYYIWLAVNIPFAAAIYLLWQSEWWHSIAPRLMGL